VLVPDTQTQPPEQPASPRWLVVLAGLSFLLFLITGPEQLYYVLYGINPQVFGIGPHTNFFGELWYAYVLQGDSSYTRLDAGLLTGAIEDAFMLAPLYLITGIGLLRRAAWVVPVGLVTAGMIWYAILYFILTSTLSGLGTVTNALTFWIPLVPYVAYPLWLTWTLIFRKNLFSRRKGPALHSRGRETATSAPLRASSVTNEGT
jgi:hypothetical protein